MNLELVWLNFLYKEPHVTRVIPISKQGALDARSTSTTNVALQ